MQEELKGFGLSRSPLAGIGKRIRNHLWVHVDYLPRISKALAKHPIWKALPDDAHPVIARINLKNWNELTLIECPQFDSANEPVVGRSFTLSPDHLSLRLQNPTKNPLIYHHKWLFVDDQYPRFNVVASKKRSLAWRRIAGKDAYLSSRIGRQEFWRQWLSSVDLPE
jgi:hypothetical protein